MATNCPQQLKPRAWRSARCSTTACSNWRRENNCNIWLKMLDTRITAAVVLPTIYVFSTQTVADCYRRRSKPNLDKSEFTQTIFVTKFNPAGNALVYSTLINGASSAAGGSGFGIAVDSTGAAYVVGNTNAADFPTVNPFQSTLGNSGESAFVLKLAPDGPTIVYSTYFGGRNVGDFTEGNAIALDSSRNAYVAGDTNSFNFPTVNPFQATLNGSISSSQN